MKRIVPQLLQRFSSREGYRAFNDAIPTLQLLTTELGVRTAVVSNADARIRLALKDLGFPASLCPIVLSEEAGAHKPSREIFQHMLSQVNSNSEIPITPEDCLHVGDEFDCDYQGALDAGMNGLLLQRVGQEVEYAHKAPQGSLDGVHVVHNLHEVVRWVRDYNVCL